MNWILVLMFATGEARIPFESHYWCEQVASRVMAKGVEVVYNSGGKDVLIRAECRPR